MNTNLSLKQKNIGIFSFLILVVFISGAIIFYSLDKAKEDTDITNVLGRQRMLSQAMGKAALGTAMAKSRKKTIEQEVDALDRYITQMRGTYTRDVIVPVKKVNLKISMDPEAENVPAVPFPATLTRMVNEKFGAGRDFSIDIISDNPVNPNKGLKTELDKEAFTYLKNAPADVFSKVYEENGKLFIGLYTADLASVEACASCHTSIKGKTFKVGDILGIRQYRLLFSDDVALGKSELQAGLGEYDTARKVFAATLTAVKNGGDLPMDLAMKETKPVPAITDEAARNKLNEIESKFKEFTGHVGDLLSSEVNSKPYRQAQQSILVSSNELRGLSDQLVNVFADLANKNQSAIRLTVIFSSLVTLVILIWVMSYLARSVIAPVTDLSRVLGEIAKGDFMQEKLPVVSSDEIGALAGTYNTMLNTMRQIVSQAEDIAQGNLDKQYELKGDLAHAFAKMIQELKEKQIADRKFKEIAEERRLQAEDLQKKVDHMLQVVNSAARGDLTRKVAVTGKDAIGQMGTGLIIFFKKLTESLGAILKASDTLSRSANEISSAVQDQASVSAQQSSSVSEISSTVEELSQSSSQVAGNANHVAEFSANALRESERGVETLETLKAKMDEITDDNHAGIKEIVDLGKKSNEIGKVME
ncbi:MAG: HAMP domain-containing protein, partial [Nitrospinae bacterium]|nr:HAMP domain-containing protein [Nitrospinota bacterium]